MIGVVLWSKPEAEQAVIWCEDHGQLALLTCMSHLMPDADWPIEGDVVDLRTETIGDVRYARAVTITSEGRVTALTGALRAAEPAPRPAPVLRLAVNNPRPALPRGSLRVANGS